jgi:hypothetical protein
VPVPATWLLLIVGVVVFHWARQLIKWRL